MNAQNGFLNEIISLELFVWDDKNDSGEVLDKAIELYDKKNELKKIIVSGWDGQGFFINTSDDKTYVLSQSAKENGKWQTTMLFDKRPISDSGTSDLMGALDWLFRSILISELEPDELAKLENFLN